MMKLAKTIQLDQDKLRKINYPLRITKDEFNAKEDTRQGYRLKRRYDILQEWYAQEICEVKREWTLGRWEDQHYDLKSHEERSLWVANDLNIKWGWDISLLLSKMIMNYDYARANDNKFLMRETLHGFPCMNYSLGEGPYKPDKDALFGGEDFHVILRGDEGTLIYFVPDRDGLNKGKYVECLL